MVPKIVVGIVDEDLAEADECDEVRQCHEGIEAVGKVPDDGETCHATHEHRSDIEDAICHCPSRRRRGATATILPFGLKIFHRLLAIITPSEDGTEGEGELPDIEQWASDIGYLGLYFWRERSIFRGEDSPNTA